MTHAERYAAGKALREKCPRTSHGAWKPPSDRRDAVELLPLRHGRMVRSTFTFYRGAALTMAADLARTFPPGEIRKFVRDAALARAVRQGKVKAVFEEAK